MVGDIHSGTGNCKPSQQQEEIKYWRTPMQTPVSHSRNNRFRESFAPWKNNNAIAAVVEWNPVATLPVAGKSDAKITTVIIATGNGSNRSFATSLSCVIHFCLQ